MKFKISSELKNIIGQDLIVNDQVAIFELVKVLWRHFLSVDNDFTLQSHKLKNLYPLILTQ
jgi:hypothetical protein